MKITAIDEQKKNKERLSVFVDGEFLFGVHPDVLIEHGLTIGRELDEAAIAAVKMDDAFRVAYDKAIGYLAGRPHSTREVRQYLRDKLIYRQVEYREIADSDAKDQYVREKDMAIDRIIGRLEERRYIDDAAFASWWIANRREFRPRGKRLLLLELKAKGVSDEDIATALTTPSEEGHFHSEKRSDEDSDEIGGPETEVALALRLASKQQRKYAGLGVREFNQKMSRYLAAKGFDWDVVEEVLTRLRGVGR